MITSKIKTRHWFLLLLIAVALVLFPIVLAFALALSRGEQYHAVAEEFQSVFYLSMIFSVALLIIGIILLRDGEGVMRTPHR